MLDNRMENASGKMAECKWEGASYVVIVIKWPYEISLETHMMQNSDVVHDH